MKLKLLREKSNEKCTIGSLYLDGVFECYTLEDIIREVKIWGATAIPQGIYKVIIDFSEHFKKDMPHILNVPDYEGLRIHSGNKAEDTEGCILVGQIVTSDRNSILDSRIAYNELFPKLEKAILQKEEITIEIINT